MRHPSTPLALTAALLAFATGLPLLRAATTPVPATAAAPESAGMLRLSESQWRTLGIQPAGRSAFATVLVADAVIALDDDATVPVFAPASGRIADVRARVGQRVARGQALAMFSGIESAQAAADLASAEAARISSTEQLDVARAVERRAHAVLDAGGGTEKDWFQSRADLAAASAAKASADAAYAAARTKAEAVGWSSSTPIEDAARPSALRAPIDGEIVQRQVAAGQLVSSLASGASAPLFTISDLRHVWVVASVAEADSVGIHVGQAADVSSIGLGGTPLRARVSWVAPTLDPTTRRLPIRLTLPNPDGVLRPQATATVRLLDADAPPSVSVPASAIIRDGAAARCYVVVGERTIAARGVRIGRTEGGLTQVTSGLAAGERVVVRGALFVDAMNEGGGAS